MPDQPNPPSAERLFHHPPFVRYFAMRSFSEFAYQMGAVAVGWQIYSLTHSALKLGLIGLAQFLPTLAFTLVAGHVADRHDRRLILLICQIAEAAAALFLAWGSFGKWLTPNEIFGVVTVFGTTIAFQGPASSALLYGVTPSGQIQKSSAITTTSGQIAVIGGPALGGLLYAVGSYVPYVIMAICWSLSFIAVLGMKLDKSEPASDEPVSWETILAGFKFVWKTPEILGTISLDLFAVLLGGATALLPIYAHDILHTGAWGLGILRGAPAIGALLTGLILAHRPLSHHVGVRMFQAVIAFGAATIVFSLSHLFWLSLLALAFMGAADTVSMVIRISLVQLATPDKMRGRVGAVNYLFVNTSNQLGEFESGALASFIGAVPTAVFGGIGTIVVALLWMVLFPKIRSWDSLS